MPLIVHDPASATAVALGIGIYSVPEAARVTGIHPSRIRRWMRGYSYQRSDGRARSAAIWHGQLKPHGNAFALGFRDLMEVRFVDAFLKVGVSWKTMRRAHDQASQELGTEHPFCSNRFVTDGRSILLLEAEKSGDVALLDIVTASANSRASSSRFSSSWNSRPINSCSAGGRSGASVPWCSIPHETSASPAARTPGCQPMFSPRASKRTAPRGR